MEMKSPTTFTNRCRILSELWMDYRQDEEFKDFMEYNDLGLPLAYALSEGIVERTDLASTFINEAFDILLTAVDVEDTGFETLTEVLDK
jgi:hypothetical protein